MLGLDRVKRLFGVNDQRGPERAAPSRLLSAWLVMTRLTVFLSSAAAAWRGTQQAKPPRRRTVGVTVIQVAMREVPITFEAVGRTEGSREVDTSARRRDPRAAEIQEGDSVKAGATLFESSARRWIELAQARAPGKAARTGGAGARASEGPRRQARHQPEGGRPGGVGLQQARPRPGGRARCARPSSAFPTPGLAPIAASPDGRCSRSAAWFHRAAMAPADGAHADDPLWVRSRSPSRSSRGARRRRREGSEDRPPTAGLPRPASSISPARPSMRDGTVQMRAGCRTSLRLPGQFVVCGGGAVQAVSCRRARCCRTGRALRLDRGGRQSGAAPITGPGWARTGRCSRAWAGDG
jgi:hypothetical protein